MTQFRIIIQWNLSFYIPKLPDLGRHYISARVAAFTRLAFTWDKRIKYECKRLKQHLEWELWWGGGEVNGDLDRTWGNHLPASLNWLGDSGWRICYVSMG
jgi:hypothetical protein